MNPSGEPAKVFLAPTLLFSYTEPINNEMLSALQVWSVSPGGMQLKRDRFRGVVCQPTIEWDA